MDQIEGQWIPQAGLILCLSDPTAGQSQLPLQLAVCWALGGCYTEYLSVTNSDLLLQMRFVSEVKDLSRILVPI